MAKKKTKVCAIIVLQVPFTAKGGLLHSWGLLSPRVRAKSAPAQDSAVWTLVAASWIIACKKGILT